MALKETAAGSYISRSSGFISYTNHTSMCWYKTPPTAWGTENSIFDLEGTGYHYCFVNGIGDLQLDTGPGGLNAAALTLDTLYHITMQGDGTNVRLYLNGVQAVSRANTTITPTFEAWGGYVASPLNAGTFAALKQWSAILTADEILNEMRSYLPKRGLNLHTFVPLLNHTDLVNRTQGVGYTATGSLAYADGPSISWGAPVLIVPGVGVVLTQTQEGFRFFNDDGSESASTGLAVQDANASLAVDTPTRLRMLIDATGNPASSEYKLQYRKVGAASWKNVA